jgi:RNA polymerase sigma-70 factor (ECF subfamily)
MSTGKRVDTFGLLQRIRAGDRQAADELFAAHQDRLCLAIRIGFPRELRAVLDAEDLVQRTVLNALLALDDFEYSGEGTFLSWLTRIAANQIRDALRHHGRQRRDVRREHHLESEATGGEELGRRLSAEQPTPSEHAIGNETRALLERGLDSLSERHRELLVQIDVLGVEAEVIAEREGKSVDAIRVAAHRAKNNLAAWFERQAGRS